MSLLQLPIDRGVDLRNASYKNPARVVIRSLEPAAGWVVYFGIDTRFWRLGEIRLGSQGTAMVFGIGAADHALGVNESIAKMSGNLATDTEIHAADTFYVFGVSPDGSRRTRVFNASNDKYVPENGVSGPPWARQRWQGGLGAPVKVPGARGIFDRPATDFPPGLGVPDPDEPDEPEDPVTSAAPNLLEDVRRERAKYPTPMDAFEQGRLLNAVAWEHRDQGFRLAGKAVGVHAFQPGTDLMISRDILIHEPSGRMFDVLRDAGGVAEPVWNDVGPVDMPIVMPVDVEGPPPPDEPDDPVDPPDPPDEPDGPIEGKFSDDDIRAIFQRAAELMR